METGHDPFATLKSTNEEYSVYDTHYERIGKVDDLLLDEHDRVAYVGVKMGFFGTNSTLVPVEIVRVNDKRRLIEIAESAETIKHAPHFGRDETVSPELEDRVRNYFGLEPLHSSTGERAAYPSDESLDRFGPDARVDTEPGERAEQQQGAALDEPAYREGGRPEEAGAVSGERPETVRGDRWDRQTTEGGVTVHRRTR